MFPKFQLSEVIEISFIQKHITPDTQQESAQEPKQLFLEKTKLKWKRDQNGSKAALEFKFA